MTDTRPRDLTATELELLAAPAARSTESMPLAIPPGMWMPVSLLDPAQSIAVDGAPTAEPPEASG